MLAQFGCSRSGTRSRYFRHIDPLSFGRLDWTFTPRVFMRRSGVQRCRHPMITCPEARAIIWRLVFMHIAFAASECVPFSKTGGLADVVGALPRALVAAGHQVSVYIPRYRQTKLSDAQTVVRSITVPFDDHYRFCSVVSAGSKSGVDHYFVEYPPFFDRDALYGTSAGDYPDNAERFALFSRAVLEASKILGVPQIFHCHDWQSALVPVLLRTQYAEDPAFRDVATVFTIHNMGYQGLFPPDTLPLLTLPWDLLAIDKMEFFGQVNFLKGALVYADLITTVSRKYSHEIQTAEFGFGLEGVLRDRASTVTGILNGVDYDEWSPQTDKFIAAKYSPQDLSGKAQCKQDLLATFGIANVDAIAHKIEAGADMFLMPSRYEPCGLNQIYSLKYGTVPIVRATGGLDDTIDPWDARTGKGTGFKFTEYIGESLLLTIKQALDAYTDQTSWQALMRNGMTKDFSWNASAREYGRIYDRVRQSRGTTPVPQKALATLSS